MKKLDHGAIAVFVKTPGYSPLKTRLAASIGTDKAMEFYHIATACIQEQLEKTRNIFKPFWAVAEENALDVWTDFDVIWQGEGGLGDRLHKVYNELINRFSCVALIGADAPQLSSEVLLKSLTLLETSDFVIGPATDGGFYLFLGKTPLPKSVWMDVSYSEPTTLEELLHLLRGHGSIYLIEELNDVDTIDDLVALRDTLEKTDGLDGNLGKLYQQLQDLSKV